MFSKMLRPRPVGSALLALVLLLGAASPALAQGQLPTSVPVGDGHMTVGFELKTTTHGDGPNGRTAAHSLMRYIRPKASASWTDAQRQVVDRWESASVRERTRFFFENYAGGHHSTNFEVNTEKYPMLDGSVSWYGHMNIPHIEVRSKPYENPREAMADMKRLKADVRETIAFHMHTRFPDTSNSAQAGNLTSWLRRVSWAIWLNRAHVSSRTDFVLKSMDNQPVNVGELEKALAAFVAENPTARKDIIERRGIRVSRLRNPAGEGNLLDIEFRGLMRDTGRLERYLQLTADAFRNGNFGPWSFTEGPFRGHESAEAIQFRTFGWHGTGSWNENELKWLADSVEALRAEHGVSSNLSAEQLAAAVRAMATADTAGGKKMLLPSAFNWLFLPTQHDAALPEGIQEQVEQKKAEYVRKLVRLAERVHAGEFGQPGQSGFQPMSVATRVRRILHDFVNESFEDAGTRGKLYEWYERSLSNPEEVAERTARWRAQTGRNRAEAFAQIRAAREAERAAARAAADGFEDALRESAAGNRGSRRATASSSASGSASANVAVESHHQAPNASAGSHVLGAEVAALESAVRRGARNAYPNVHWMARSGHEQLKVEVVDGSQPKVTALIRRAGSTVRVTRGMLDKLADASSDMSAEEAKAFRARALMILSLEAMNRATSMELDLEKAARRSGVLAGERLATAEVERLRTLSRRAGVPMPEVASRLVEAPSGGAVGNGTGIIGGAASEQAQRRIRDRTRTGRRARRGR